MTDLQILVIVIFVISAFVIGIPLIYGICLPIFKPKISSKATKYIYAFSSGFFIMMSTVLFIGESKTHLEEEFTTIFQNNIVLVKTITGIMIAFIIFLGLIFSLGLKYFFAKHFKGKAINSENETKHDHDGLIFNLNDHNPKSKAFAIFFLLSHRIPDGLIIGTLATQIAKSGNINPVNIIFLCSFIIHIIPEELIIYYRQIEMNVPVKKATINSLIAVCSIIPLIILGSVITWFSLNNEFAIHIVQLIAASFLLFISIVEFIPEFIHDVKTNGKQWYIIILIWIIGLTAGIFVLSFHDHGTSHMHFISKITL